MPGYHTGQMPVSSTVLVVTYDRRPVLVAARMSTRPTPYKGSSIFPDYAAISIPRIAWEMNDNSGSSEVIAPALSRFDLKPEGEYYNGQPSVKWVGGLHLVQMATPAAGRSRIVVAISDSWHWHLGTSRTYPFGGEHPRSRNRSACGKNEGSSQQ